MTFYNPHIGLIIKGAEDWDSDQEPTRLEMSINVMKDLDGEPNEATVEIYNLNADTRNRIIDPSVRDTPIEISFAPFGTDDLHTCFVGEIERARSFPTRPGMTTQLTCKSQMWQARNRLFEPTTYEAGTPIRTIITSLTDTIGLPVQVDNFKILETQMRQTLSGPAFLLLKKFIYQYGLFTYICDGTLYISDVYDIPNPTIVEITKNMMVSEPEPTERKDAVDVLLHTIVEANNLDPFAKKRKKRRNKRKLRKLAPSAKAPTSAAAAKRTALEREAAARTAMTYVEYETVDDIIFGKECETLGTPAINPDNIVRFEGDDQDYRVQVVTHQGDTREGVTTLIRADMLE